MAVSQDPRSCWPVDETSVGTGLPLEGVRVLDLTRVVAGPLAAQIASDLGADVIKVEQPGGDMSRGFGPPSVHGIATYFLSINRNRRSVVIDQRTDEGQQLVADLAGAADAVIENYLPSQAQRLGFTALRQSLPHVVWVTVASASAGGPLADEPNFDLIAQARSGIMSVTGTAESGPTKIGAPMADVTTGLYAAIGMLAGLFDRSQHPERKARHIEAPLLESSISALTNQTSNYLGAGVVPKLIGNDHPNIVPYAPFATKDLPLLLAVASQKQWEGLCRALGQEAWIHDERYETNEQRVLHRDELRQDLEAMLTTRGAEDWMPAMVANEVPCSPINDLPAVFAQEQIASGDLVQTMELEGGPVKVVGSPLTIDGVRPALRRPAPTLGQHSEAIIDYVRRHRS
jgi:crotonobetainyl-CoA:carnitine CoA-transferase CaiB-like acyl-CoA transferase